MSITASVCCIALFKAVAACVYAGEDGKLIDAMVHGGDATGSLLSLLPGRKSKKPEKHAKALIEVMTADVEHYLTSERVNDRDSVLENINIFGPKIIEHNVASLTDLIVKEGNGDWSKATSLVLGNIPDGRNYEPFGDQNPGPERVILKSVLDMLHQALLAPKDLRQTIYAAMQSDVQKRLGGIKEDTATIKVMVEKLLAKSDMADAQQQEIEALRNTLADLQTAEDEGDEDADAALAEILATGDTAKAEEFYRKRAAKREGMAQKNNRLAAADWRAIGALAFLSDIRTALHAYEKAVAIDAENAEGWNELGHLLRRIGELDRAIEAFKKVEIIGEIQDHDGMRAAAYGNLGIVYDLQGNLDAAEKMYDQNIRLQKSTLPTAGMANNYGNLGIICHKRGDLVAAEELYVKSLELNKLLNRNKAMSEQYSNLGVLYQDQGNLQAAEAMYKESLEIERLLDDEEGMAVLYANLGLLNKAQGDHKSARNYWRQSLSMFKEFGAKPMIEKVQNWLDSLPQE